MTSFGEAFKSLATSSLAASIASLAIVSSS